MNLQKKNKMNLLRGVKKSFIRRNNCEWGDPIYSSKELIPFLVKYKKENPTHTIWLYTGFKYEDIANNEVLKLVDVLVDGEYIEELRDITLAFRGSKNQRIIRLS